jgi:thymidylate synthase
MRVWWMINSFDKEYLKLCQNVSENGFWEYNKRTEKKCLKIHGAMMKFDLSSGQFPLLTLRKMYTNGMIGELLGFIRGFNIAAQFRELGCNFWDANANKSKDWLENPNRKGEDDLGRIYGVQARDWRFYDYHDPGKWSLNNNPYYWPDNNNIDQLKDVIEKITKGEDNRRLIVTHLNPAEIDQMALYPCHMMYQFGLRGDTLDLAMYQRSADVPLGVPTNIASYALLLHLVARITNKKIGVFTHFLFNTHFYEDQVEGMQELIARDGFEAPTIWINPEIKTLKDLETWVTPDDIKIQGYLHGKRIIFPFSE